MPSPRCRKPCNDCPWRKDAPPGHWHPDHFHSIWRTCQDDGTHIMQCHKSKPESEQILPCQGWVRVVGDEAIGVRIGLFKGTITREELADRAGVGVTLYASFEEMVRAQGIVPGPRNTRRG